MLDRRYRMHICCTCSRKIFQQRGGCKRDIARIQKNPLRPRLHLSLEGVEGETTLSKSHPNDSRLLRRWQPTWPLDPLKHPSYESRSIGCAPLSDDAQPISFPPRFTEPDSHLIVGTGFQIARFRIQNHFFCLGGRPTIFFSIKFFSMPSIYFEIEKNLHRVS